MEQTKKEIDDLIYFRKNFINGLRISPDEKKRLLDELENLGMREREHKIRDEGKD